MTNKFGPAMILLSRLHPEHSACSAGAETIVYDRGLLLLAGLVREKNTILTENLRSFTTKRTGRLVPAVEMESHF